MKSTSNSIRILGLAMALSLAAAGAFAADKADGTVAYKTFTSPVKYAWLVRGPDRWDANKSVMRIYLSSADIGAKIKACKTQDCADGALGDGAMIDFGSAHHLDYAVRLNGERAQYSGSTDSGAFALTTNTAERLAGKFQIDDTAMGGAKIDAGFDLTVAATFKAAR